MNGCAGSLPGVRQQRVNLMIEPTLASAPHAQSNSNSNAKLRIRAFNFDRELESTRACHQQTRARTHASGLENQRGGRQGSRSRVCQNANLNEVNKMLRLARLCSRSLLLTSVVRGKVHAHGGVERSKELEMPPIGPERAGREKDQRSKMKEGGRGPGDCRERIESAAAD